MEEQSIDWEAQWQLFAPGFSQGVLPLELPDGQVVNLLPGAGFGDFSHPTTKLMKEALCGVVAKRDVIDIGTGSGILAVVANALGANSVIAYECEPAALEHAKKNLLYNGCTPSVYATQNEGPRWPSEPLLLLNMIRSEQDVVYKQYPYLQRASGELLVGGLLEEEEKEAVAVWQQRGWQLVGKRLLEGWLLLHLKKPEL